MRSDLIGQAIQITRRTGPERNLTCFDKPVALPVRWFETSGYILLRVIQYISQSYTQAAMGQFRFVTGFVLMARYGASTTRFGSQYYLCCQGYRCSELCLMLSSVAMCLLSRFAIDETRYYTMYDQFELPV